MADFEEVFGALRALLTPHADKLIVKDDAADVFHLDTPHIMKNKKPLFFGSAVIKRNYVAYHLMPIYSDPDLLNDMSEALKKRMQGKSCFNFRSTAPALFEELDGLTHRGFARYAAHGYVAATPD